MDALCSYRRKTASASKRATATEQFLPNPSLSRDELQGPAIFSETVLTVDAVSKRILRRDTTRLCAMSAGAPWRLCLGVPARSMSTNNASSVASRPPSVAARRARAAWA